MIKNTIILTAILAMFGWVALGTNAYAQAEVINNSQTQDLSGMSLGVNPCGGSAEIILDQGAWVKVHEQVVILPNGNGHSSTQVNVHGQATDTDGNEYIFMNGVTAKTHTDIDGVFIITVNNVRIISVANEEDSYILNVRVVLDAAGGPPQVIIQSQECR